MKTIEYRILKNGLGNAFKIEIKKENTILKWFGFYKVIDVNWRPLYETYSYSPVNYKKLHIRYTINERIPWSWYFSCLVVCETCIEAKKVIKKYKQEQASQEWSECIC